jgi:DNA-binding NarL/FixJ family response regulator
METIRLVLVDDQRLFVDNLKIVLEARTEDIKVLGISYDAASGIALIEQLEPDLVLLDVRMPGMDGVEAAKRIHASRPGIKLIMLTTFDDDQYVHEAFKHGASGYVLKNVSPAELIEAIRAAQSGSRPLPRPALPLIERTRPPASTRDTGEMRALFSTLTARELQIVKLISLAYDNRHIAARFGIAEQTVKNSLSAIYAKLNVSKRTQLMRFFDACKEKGIVD